jgi:hypothetical protein
MCPPINAKEWPIAPTRYFLHASTTLIPMPQVKPDFGASLKQKVGSRRRRPNKVKPDAVR